jgi:hypothetical protein
MDSDNIDLHYSIISERLPSVDYIQSKFHVNVRTLFETIERRLRENSYHSHSLHNFRSKDVFNFSLGSILEDSRIDINSIDERCHHHWHGICLTMAVLLILMHNPALRILKYNVHTFEIAYGLVGQQFDRNLMDYANILNHVAQVLTSTKGK